MSVIGWTRGYSASELERAQTLFRLSFPPDLIELLRDRRPVDGPDWTDESSPDLIELLRDRRPVDGPDWTDESGIRSSLAWPFEGLLFDVEQNDFWWAEWGPRPDRAKARAEILRDVLAKAPRLIPIFGHRYLPETPALSGNPVFSVYQSDVIHYGADLYERIRREPLAGDASRDRLLVRVEPEEWRLDLTSG